MRPINRRAFLRMAGASCALVAGGKAFPAPQRIRETFLLGCHVAGTSHLDLRNVEPSLQPGHFFRLRREPGNACDNLAILVLDRRGRKLGYIPMVENPVLARLLDAGDRLVARLDAKEWRGSWLKLDVSVFRIQP